MSIIYFFSGTEILMLGLMLFALIFMAADTAVKVISVMLNILLVIFIIKAFIQDVIMGIFKQKNNIVFMLLCMVNDAVRIYLFFHLMFELNKEYSNAAGLSAINAIIGFIGVFVVGGIIFIIGDFLGTTNGLKIRGKSNIATSLFSNLLPTVILGLFYIWCQ